MDGTQAMTAATVAVRPAWHAHPSGRVAIVAGVLALNAAAFFLPIDYRSLGDLNYLGAFLLTFVANATIVVPIPYLPIVGQIALAAPSAAPVVLAAALGSALGESTGFFVGRAGEGVASRSRIYLWMHRVSQRPLAAGVLLFFLAAPLNPLFDIAGIAAGALGVRYRVFFTSVLLGRVLRFAVLAAVMTRVFGG